MNKKPIQLLTLVILFFNWNSYAQSISYKVLDSLTQNPIPYATVLLNNKGVITNEEGQFTINFEENFKETDSLLISCMGYESLGKPVAQLHEKAILLSPKAIELKEVIVSNKNYTAEEIMDFVTDNLDKNHDNVLSKKRLFHRQSNFNSWTKSNFTVKKSTIDVLDQRFLDSIISEIPKNDNYYSEVLGDLYGSCDAEMQKLDLLRASKLYDKNTELDAEKLQEKFIDILRDNIKAGSYFKIKSGILSFKIDADEVSELFEEEVDSTTASALKNELEESKKDKKAEKENYGNWRKNKLGGIMASLPTVEDTELNFITKSRKYEYALQEFTYLGDDPVYVIDFSSKGSADYKGTIFINADDFAVLQVHFENIKPLKKFNLLGVSANKYLSKGKIIYAKGTDGHYGLRYFESETATRVGIKRSLKIFEKNRMVKGRNKQNELSGTMDFAFSNREKNEVVVFETETIPQSAFGAFMEKNNVLPEYMANYDPNFWKGYTIMEPNTVIKEFTSTAQ
jgi:hypothetical protein